MERPSLLKRGSTRPRVVRIARREQDCQMAFDTSKVTLYIRPRSELPRGHDRELQAQRSETAIRGRRPTRRRSAACAEKSVRYWRCCKQRKISLTSIILHSVCTPSKLTYRVSGQSPCGQTGELSSGSMTGRLLTWTSWITIEGGQHHALADEEPAASWRTHR